jgi:phosphoribosyl 1,2-cyclic phosphate phosphodiesterase
LFIANGKILVDCPEDIGDSLYRNGIQNVEHLFITHWHPDHTSGLRVVLESVYDFYLHETKKPITLHLPRRVYEDIKKYYPSISYLVDVRKMAVIEYIEHGQSIAINDISITAVGFSGELSHTFGYLFESDGKKCLYTPCDTIEVTEDIVNEYFQNLDVLVHECGILSPEVKTELSFDSFMNRVRSCNPKKTIVTHIEEIEVKRW